MLESKLKPAKTPTHLRKGAKHNGQFRTWCGKLMPPEQTSASFTDAKCGKCCDAYTKTQADMARSAKGLTAEPPLVFERTNKPGPDVEDTLQLGRKMGKRRAFISALMHFAQRDWPAFLDVCARYGLDEDAATDAYASVAEYWETEDI